MITKMEVFSAQPSAPELPLGGFMPSDDPVHVRDIQGLGPVKADFTSTALASGRGEQLQGSSTGKRNIVLTLGLKPDWENQTMATLRQLLYAYLMPEQWCKLRFFTDYLPTVDIEGYVESFEPNIFSEDPEVQISVLCHKPDFIEADATIIEGAVDDGSLEVEFEYIGTIATGFEVRVQRTVGNPSYTGALEIVMRSPIEAQAFEVDPVTIDTDKYFKLSTVRHAKRVVSIAHVDGNITNLLGSVTSLSVWPEIKPGTNVISVSAEEPNQAWTLAYFNRFGGL